jgi:hypothetical protein
LVNDKKNKGEELLDNGYLDNNDNGFSNKYEKILWICSSTYRLMVIQILCNFIIIS